MEKISAKDIKTLRQETGAGIMEVKKALEEAKGKLKQAKVKLKKLGLEKAGKRAGREAKEGRVYGYIHSGGRIGAMVKVMCETDFVAKSEEFEKLCKELAMQVASMEPKTEKELLNQTYIRDKDKKVKELVEELAGKVKEKIVVAEIVRLKL